jgi:hypothetical protein
LHARQVDLEAAEVELERQRQDFVHQQAAHPLGDNDDACIGAPGGLCFPAQRTTWWSPLATWKTSPTCQIQRPMSG